MRQLQMVLVILAFCSVMLFWRSSRAVGHHASETATAALPTQSQQRSWQARWSRTAASEAAIKHYRPVARPAVVAERGALLDEGRAHLPVLLLEEPQAPEARRAVQIALSQPIPAQGDGRRGGYDDQRNVKRESDTVRKLLQQGGLGEWRPSSTCFPPQARPGASMGELLREVPKNGTAWLAFGNAGVTEMLMNWVHAVCKLGVGGRIVVAAYDADLLATLRTLSIPSYNYTGALPQIHFRGTPFLFHRMGFLKAMTIKEV